MITPRWIRRIEVDAIHDELVQDSGGLPGVRDANLVESALARPQNLYAYGEPDLPEMAAAYAFGIAKNHGYADGNKRTGFVVCATFLILNGRQLTVSEGEAEAAMVDLARGALTEVAFAEWLRENLHKLSKPAKAG